MKINDTLMNLVSGLNVFGRDKQTARSFVHVRMSPQEIDAAYQGDWIARKIVDIPAFDMTRAWRTFQVDKKDIGLLEDEEKRLGIRQKFAKAIWWGRLRGGGALLLVDGSDNLMEPLNVSEKGGLRQVAVLPKERCRPGQIDWDPYSPTFDQPISFAITGGQRGSVDVHPSRVITFSGAQIPDDVAQSETKVYGESILIAVRDAVMQAAAVNAGISSLVEEAKVDVIKVPGLLVSAMNTEWRNNMQARWELAAILRASNNITLMDSQEEWDRREINFSGLTDVARLFLQVVSGAADIPATRMLNQSPAGMNATGESDLQNYEAHIAAKQGIELDPRLARLDEVLLVSALGSTPKASQWSRWNPLRVPTPKEASEMDKAEAETARTIADSGLVPTAALEVAFQNRLIESGRWPGLEDAIQEAKKGLLLPFEDPADDGNDIDPKTGLPYPAEDPRSPQAKAANQNEERDITVNGGKVAIKARVRRPTVDKVRDAKPAPLYVSRALLNAQEVIDWFKGQGLETTVAAGEMHVTIAYSKRPLDWMKVPADWWSNDRETGKLIVPPGGPRQMDLFGARDDALVLLIQSEGLTYRHRAISEAGASWDWEDYQPHVTITYAAPEGLDLSTIKPFQGRLEFGPEVFEEIVENFTPSEETA